MLAGVDARNSVRLFDVGIGWREGIELTSRRLQRETCQRICIRWEISSYRGTRALCRRCAATAPGGSGGATYGGGISQTWRTVPGLAKVRVEGVSRPEMQVFGAVGLVCRRRELDSKSKSGGSLSSLATRDVLANTWASRACLHHPSQVNNFSLRAITDADCQNYHSTQYAPVGRVQFQFHMCTHRPPRRCLHLPFPTRQGGLEIQGPETPSSAQLHPSIRFARLW